MIRIILSGESDSSLIASIGKASFIESHGISAPERDIKTYTERVFSEENVRLELNDPENIYHHILSNDQPAGYSKLILNKNDDAINSAPVAKLERIYLLKEYYGSGAGSMLMEHNIQLSLNTGQKGMWLYVWKDNNRALEFYLRKGFRIIGEHDFKISDSHYNPNYKMLLEF